MTPTITENQLSFCRRSFDSAFSARASCSVPSPPFAGGAPSRCSSAWYDDVPSAQLFLSVLTLGEIRLGVERARRKDPAKAATLENWLVRLQSVYAAQIVPVDAVIADVWAQLSVPDPLPVIDGLLAATACVRNLTLVTRNTAGIQRCGVRLLNPFEPL
jgi:predicted nucleic acid-binding protein